MTATTFSSKRIDSKVKTDAETPALLYAPFPFSFSPSSRSLATNVRTYLPYLSHTMELNITDARIWDV